MLIIVVHNWLAEILMYLEGGEEKKHCCERVEIWTDAIATKIT